MAKGHLPCRRHSCQATPAVSLVTIHLTPCLPGVMYLIAKEVTKKERAIAGSIEAHFVPSFWSNGCW